MPRCGFFGERSIFLRGAISGGLRIHAQANNRYNRCSWSQAHGINRLLTPSTTLGFRRVNVAAETSESSDTQKPPTFEQSLRETVESVAVAFILAFLFRAFVAEAFVIPTGSMAPTLMGAHKDIACAHCGQRYQAGASSEFDADSGRFTSHVTVGSTCSVCRGVNAYDLRGNPNHVSFSGDRILVSKFDYVLHEPERWDVFVFKYFEHARMNYIKRLVGLPGETLRLSEGDVYVKANGAEQWTMARKPPHKIKAMRQLVADTDRRPKELLEQGWPSLWQPQDDEASAWEVIHTPQQWMASVKQANPDWQWLRYYHNFVPEEAWIRAIGGEQLPVAPPKSARLITDYLAYNSSINSSRDKFFQGGTLQSRVTEDNTMLDIAVQGAKELLARRGEDMSGLNNALDEVLRSAPRPARDDGPNNDGLHWVGDLMGEFWVDVQSDYGELAFELVEFGIKYRCTFEIATGEVTLSASLDGQPLQLFGNASELRASSRVRGRGSYRIEFANVDDQLVVWINGRVVDFGVPAEFDSHLFRIGAERRPYWTASDPLDAAPVAVGVQGALVTVNRARVYRDLYYIAVAPDGASYLNEYNFDNAATIRASVPDRVLRSKLSPAEAIAAVYSNPQWWEQTGLFALRNERQFELAEDHYLPLGDNSAASSDGRAWVERVGGRLVDHNYIEGKFLLGKALLVFWPHTWNTPVPFTPNFARMGLIR
jgi:signal peptidase I